MNKKHTIEKVYVLIHVIDKSKRRAPLAVFSHYEDAEGYAKNLASEDATDFFEVEEVDMMK